MKNIDIINAAKITLGITETIHTYAGWQARGMQVKKGSKAICKIEIWKHKSKKSHTEDGAEIDINKMFKTNAAFFGLSQVEPIKV